MFGFLSMHIKYLKDGCQEDGARLLFSGASDRGRGNRHKLKHRKFYLNRRNFFTVQVAEAGIGFPERL